MLHFTDTDSYFEFVTASVSIGAADFMDLRNEYGDDMADELTESYAHNVAENCGMDLDTIMDEIFRIAYTPNVSLLDLRNINTAHRICSNRFNAAVFHFAEQYGLKFSQDA